MRDGLCVVHKHELSFDLISLNDAQSYGYMISPFTSPSKYSVETECSWGLLVM